MQRVQGILECCGEFSWRDNVQQGDVKVLKVDATPNLSAAPSSGCGMQSLAFDAAINPEATELPPSVLARVSMI